MSLVINMDEKTVLVLGLVAFKLYLDSREKINKAVRKKIKKKKVQEKAVVKQPEPIANLRGFKIGD